jgi:hypothetical protein
MKLSVIAESSEYDVLYHGTRKALLRDIMTNGLDPAKSDCAEDEEANDECPGYPGHKGPPYHFVFLSQSPDCAASFAPGGENHKQHEGGVVLEINLPPELQKQLVLDRGEFIRAPFVIPPQYINFPRSSNPLRQI